MTLRRGKREQSTADSTKAGAAAAPAGSTRWVVWALLGILLFALCMDLAFYTGFYASDDLQYIRGATQLADTGRLSSITLGTIRLVLVLPLALVAKVTHHNLFAMASLFVLFHVLGVAGTYWLGRLAHDPETGLLAAGLMAVCPLAVFNAPLILPDHAVTSLALLATGALILAGQRISCTSGSRWSVYKLCAIGGLVFALGVGAKITAIIMLPVFLVLMLFWVRRSPASVVLKSALWFAAAATIVGGLLWGTFYLVSGLHSPFQDSKFVAILTPSPGRVTAADLTFLDRLARIEGFALSDKYLGLFRWVIPVCLITYPFLKRRSWAMYLTFLWLCVYMTWGTFSLTHYLPPPVNIRYFLLALPYALITVAFVALSIVRPLWSRLQKTRLTRTALLGLASLVGLLVIGDSCVTANRLAGKLHHSPEVSAARHALDFAAASGDRPIVLSYWLSFRLRPLFWQDAYPRVILQELHTNMGEVSSLLERDGFLYMNCAYERRPRHRGPSPSPLDVAIREALDGRGLDVSARTVGTFGQFKTRLSGIMYLLTGLGDDMGLRRDDRQVFLREVTAGTPRAEDLDESTAEELDLSRGDIWSPTWVYGVKTCDVSQAEGGAVVCEVAGSEERTGDQCGGVVFRLGPVRAVRFDVTFEQPEEIDAVFMDLTVGPDTANRLRWSYAMPSGAAVPAGRQSYTFRPGYSTEQFVYEGGPASPYDLDQAHFFIRLKSGSSRSGCRVHRVLVERLSQE